MSLINILLKLTIGKKRYKAMRYIPEFLKNDNGEVSVGYGIGYCLVGLAVLSLFLVLREDFVGFYNTVTEVMRTTRG